MAFDSFLEFAGPIAFPGASTKVVGESIDKELPAALPQARRFFETMQIVKSVDSASASLFEAAGSGAHFPQLNLYVRKAGTTSDYLIYRFKLVLVSKISWSGSSGDAQPLETVELVFGAMQVSYAAQLPSGQLSTTPIVQMWNQVSNQPNFTVPGVP